MNDDTSEPFGLPAIGRKKPSAAFDGGWLTSDGGVMLLAAADESPPQPVAEAEPSAPADERLQAVLDAWE